MHQLISILRVAAVAMLMAFSLQAYPNAMTLLGGSTQGHQCFTTAKMIAEGNFRKLADSEPCTIALKEEAMSRRDRAATFLNRGLIRAANSDFEGAHDDYDEAIKVNPDIEAIVHINRGNSYYMQQQYQFALESYSTAIEMDVKQMHVAVHNQAMVYEKLGDLEAAEAGFMKALEMVQGWETAQRRLDRVREKIREKKEKAKAQ